MNKSDLPVFVSIRTAAQLLGLGEKWLRHEVKIGAVPGVRVGSQFRVDWQSYQNKLRNGAST